MPSPSGSKPPSQSFLAKWRDQLPNVAASLTTALILFLVSLSFTPVRRWLFAGEVASYPLLCTADPVAGPGGRRIVEFYVINRSPENFSQQQLQQLLDTSLEGTGAAASASIVLPFDSEIGRIERAFADDAFNRDKGVLLVRQSERSVQLQVTQIHGGAILRAYLVLADMPDIGPISRDAKVAVPFDYRDMQEYCYTRR